MLDHVLGSGDNTVNKMRHGVCQKEDHSIVMKTDIL